MDRGRGAKKRSKKEERGKKDRSHEKETPATDDQESTSTKESRIPAYGSREEPQAESQGQYLFLLEIFVHAARGERLAKLNQMFFVPTSISFRFLDFGEGDDIEVTPVDPLFEPQAGVGDVVEHFYSGRSVMFSIDEDSTTDKTLDFTIGMKVRKKMPEGVKPDVLVGVGELDLSKHFAALRKEMLQCWHRNVPPPKVYEGEVPLAYGEEPIGTVSLYVRMSAFGQTIVTEFDSPSIEKRSYVFKADVAEEGARKGAVGYKCRIIDSKNLDVRDDSSQDLSRSCAPCQNYVDEGHSCGDPREAAVKNRDLGDGRMQDANEDSRLEERTCADTLDEGRLIQTSRGPAQPCGKAVVLKVSGLLDEGDLSGKKQPTVTVAPESEAIGPDNPPDPEHDVFVLRIGKKGLVGAGEKSDIQLEMKTPKGPEKRPPIRYETREMQTEEDEKGKKEKKGKKKKK